MYKLYIIHDKLINYIFLKAIRQPCYICDGEATITPLKGPSVDHKPNCGPVNGRARHDRLGMER